MFEDTKQQLLKEQLHDIKQCKVICSENEITSEIYY